jgi:hypothetical protein
VLVAEFWLLKNTCEEATDDASEDQCRSEHAAGHRRKHDEEEDDEADDRAAEQERDRIAVLPNTTGRIGHETFAVEEVDHDVLVAVPECGVEEGDQGHDDGGDRREEVPTG